MKAILARAQRGLLEEFASSELLLAFDFDGTLAPIVANRERAELRAGTRARLARLARIYPVVVISGRSRADVRRRLAGTGVRGVIGNHGIEPWKATARLRARVRSWRAHFEARLGALRSIEIEDKGFSLAIHYRRARAKAKVRAAILAAAGELGGMRVVGGKQVVNCVPRGAPHKGLALQHERRARGCARAIYVGDDDTDEDVFGLPADAWLLAIRVGAKRTSLARYFLRSRSEVDELLRILAELRPAGRLHEKTRS